jgi:selenocysteine-specific elongation factor
VDFIRNMVAGAHGVDVVIFVVAADDGIMPQTREHLHILTLMGLRHGLVALTKIDLVEAARRTQVIDDLRRLLAGTFLANAPIAPISNITGEGYEGFFDSLNQVVAGCENRSSAGVFRVWVEDVFTIHGPGTVVTGIPSSGLVRIGDPLTLLPAGRAGHVRRMQVYGDDATEARAGECVALNLPEFGHEEVRRGMVLCASDAIAPVTMAEGELQILDSVKGKVEDFVEAHLHVGTASVLARVALLEATEMAAGQRQMVQLRLAEPLPLVPGDRFVVRANLPAQDQTGLATIGGGRILGVSNVRLRRKKPWTLSALAARRDALDDPVRWCELMLRESGLPLSVSDLQKSCLLRPEEMTAMLEKLLANGRVVSLPGGKLTHSAVVEETAGKMVLAVASFHAANPQRTGLGREELFSIVGGAADVCELAAASLVSAKKLERQGTVFARAGWSARISGGDQQLSDRISAAFQAASWAGPTIADVATTLGEPPTRVEKMIKLLVEKAVLVRLDERLCIHRDALEAAKQVVLRLFGKKPSFSTMEFRDAVGVSRKHAVPLLDYLDRLRFTVRSGHDRTPGVEARKLLKC